jgi:hypothetical protein
MQHRTIVTSSLSKTFSVTGSFYFALLKVELMQLMLLPVSVTQQELLQKVLPWELGWPSK